MNIVEQAIMGFAAILCVLTISSVNPTWAATTQVCVDVKDKAGRVKQTCKTMKKHEKLEGTRVPEKK